MLWPVLGERLKRKEEEGAQEVGQGERSSQKQVTRKKEKKSKLRKREGMNDSRMQSSTKIQTKRSMHTSQPSHLIGRETEMGRLEEEKQTQRGT